MAAAHPAAQKCLFALQSVRCCILYWWAGRCFSCLKASSRHCSRFMLGRQVITVYGIMSLPPVSNFINGQLSASFSLVLQATKSPDMVKHNRLAQRINTLQHSYIHPRHMIYVLVLAPKSAVTFNWDNWNMSEAWPLVVLVQFSCCRKQEIILFSDYLYSLLNSLPLEPYVRDCSSASHQLHQHNVCAPSWKFVTLTNQFTNEYTSSHTS